MDRNHLKFDAHNHAYWMTDSELGLIKKNSIGGCFFGGYSPSDWELQKNFKRRVFDLQSLDLQVWKCFGFHPWYLLDVFCREKEAELPIALLQKEAQHSSFAIGETGLDYSEGLKRRVLKANRRWEEFKDFQLKIFNQHIQVAQCLKRPIVLHLVNSNRQEELLLKEFNLKQAFYHRFNGSIDRLIELLEQGSMVSFHVSSFLSSNKQDTTQVASILKFYSKQWVVESDFDKKNNHFNGFQKIGDTLARAFCVSIDDIFQWSSKNLEEFLGSLQQD